jgi:hypothetical protein
MFWSCEYEDGWRSLDSLSVEVAGSETVKLVE